MITIRSSSIVSGLFSFLVTLTCQDTFAEVKSSATSGSGSGYRPLSQAGFGIETPDCKHGSFGSHITLDYDNSLGKNVFVFHSHIDKDNDRCKKSDRVRIEIKGGSGSPKELQHRKDSTSYYRWKFKLASDFKGSSSFNHIFQNKGYGGGDIGMPIITVTPRSSILEVIHNADGASKGSLAKTSLSKFKGRWIEGYMKQVHRNDGQFEITLTDFLTGEVLLSYADSDIDLWRSGADYNRPKWGMYRKKNSVIKDEKIRFSDFCVSEVGDDECPSDQGGVEPVVVESIDLPEKITLQAGTLSELRALFYPANATNQSLSWTSSHPDVASVENGKVKAVSIGTATITAISLENGVLAHSHVTVTESDTAAEINWLTPTHNEVFDSGSNLSVEVEATVDSEIQKVELFINNKFVRTEYNAPYIWSTKHDPELEEFPVGEHELRVDIITTDGITTSSRIDISVNHGTKIEWLYPKDNAMFSEGDDISVEVLAKDHEAVDHVRLYMNEQFIRQESVSRYEWNASKDEELENVKAGEHTLRVDVKDNDGNAISSAITIHVDSGTQINWKNPIDGGVYAAGSDLEVEIAATDDGEVDNVRLYIDDQFIRQENISKYEWDSRTDYELSSMDAGEYILRADVTDSRGNVTSSSIAINFVD